MVKTEHLNPAGEQRKNPLDTMREIENSLHEPLPQPPEGATWVGKSKEEMTPEEAAEAWKFLMISLRALHQRPQLQPEPDHPRYTEYMVAKREWESFFKLTAHDLLKRFTI